MSSKSTILYLLEAASYNANAPVPGFLQAFQQNHNVRAVGVPYHGLVRLILRIFMVLAFSKRPSIILTTSYSLTIAVPLNNAKTAGVSVIQLKFPDQDDLA